MAIEDTLNSIDASLKTIVVILQSATAGNAAVAGTPAPAAPKNKKASVKLRNGDPEGTRYSYHAEDKKLHVTGPGVDLPIGTVEISGDDYTKREAEAAKNASNGAQSTAAQTPASGASSTSTGSPSFQDVTTAIQALSKAEGGRDKVVKLFAKWGVEKFPQVNGKVPNDQLLKDIAGVDEADTDDLGI